MTDPDDTKNKSPKHQQATIKIFKNLKNRPCQKTRVASNQERNLKDPKRWPKTYIKFNCIPSTLR
jgi:hypothetical protein